MAKNMESTAYRKLDVDAFDADAYEEDDNAASDTPGLGPDENTINAALSTNRFEDALHAALANPPYKTKNQGVKDKSSLLVGKVLSAVRAADIEALVKKLDDDEADLLMKYVYKCMELAPDNAVCQSMLLWHAQLVTRSGLGSIIRVFSDRKRL